MTEWCYAGATSDGGASEAGSSGFGRRSSRTETRFTVIGRRVVAVEGLSFSFVGMANLASRWQIEKKAERKMLDTRKSTDRE